MSASNMFNKTLQTSHRGVSLDKCTRISNMSTSPAYHGYGKTLHYRHHEYKTTSHGDNFLLDVTNFYLNNVFWTRWMLRNNVFWTRWMLRNNVFWTRLMLRNNVFWTRRMLSPRELEPTISEWYLLYTSSIIIALLSPLRSAPWTIPLGRSLLHVPCWYIVGRESAKEWARAIKISSSSVCLIPSNRFSHGIL